MYEDGGRRQADANRLDPEFGAVAQEDHPEEGKDRGDHEEAPVEFFGLLAGPERRAPSAWPCR